MNDCPHDDSPARLVAGALAHLARHMTTGCPRAAERAALLLARLAADTDADPHLREHARELVDILDRHDAPQRQPVTSPGKAPRIPSHRLYSGSLTNPSPSSGKKGLKQTSQRKPSGSAK